MRTVQPAVHLVVDPPLRAEDKRVGEDGRVVVEDIGRVANNCTGRDRDAVDCQVCARRYNSRQSCGVCYSQAQPLLDVRVWKGDVGLSLVVCRRLGSADVV